MVKPLAVLRPWSKVTLTTSTGEDSGVELKTALGEIKEEKIVPGEQSLVEDLFYNTPAMISLRTNTPDGITHITDVVSKAFYPELPYFFKNDGNLLPQATSWKAGEISAARVSGILDL